jgi:hypothetical protein
VGDTAAEKQIKRENFLHHLAYRPRYGLEYWSRISADERLTVLKYMRAKYDESFTQQFMRFANAGAKSPGGNIVRGPDFTPDKLQAKGFRYVGNPGGTSTWTRPNGEEVYVLGGGSAAPSTPPPPPPPPLPPTGAELLEVQTYASDLIDQYADLNKRSQELRKLKSQLSKEEYQKLYDQWWADQSQFTDDLNDTLDNVIPNQNTSQLTPAEAHERQMWIDRLKEKTTHPQDYEPPPPED